ncbi:MAG: hypothetical protein AB8B55_10235 [Mariniblastus sp.]
MKFLNSFLMLGGIAAVAFLQSPMTKTNVEARGGTLFDVQVPVQGPVTVCEVAGYFTLPCAGLVPGCTGGTVKGILVSTSGSTTEDFRELPTSTARGLCTGNSNCVTPKSSDITSAGC